MTDLNIRYGPSSSIFINGQINPKLIIEAGCWYLCTDTAELFLGVDTGIDLTLKRINDPAIAIPVDELVLRSDLTELKQEIIQIVQPDVEEVKTKVETVLPKVENEIVPTISEVKTKVEEEILPKVETVDTLKNWVENKEYLQDIDLEGYATESYVKKAIAEAELNGKEVDLSGLATKDDIKNLATASYVDEKVAEIAIPEVPTKVSELLNDKNYISEIPNEYVTDSELAAKGYLTEHQSLANYATKTFVENAVAENQPNLTKYALKTDLPDVSNFLTSVPSEYVTDDKLAAKSYLTETKAAAEYAKKSDLFSKSYNDLTDTPVIPSISGLATEAYVDKAVANLDIPDVDLSAYALKADVSVKADEIPFISDKYVTNALGSFVAGDTVKGLTIAELFAKLLGLSNINPDSKTLEEIIQEIKINEQAMYAVNSSGELEKLAFNYLEFDQTSAKAVPTESGFYQIFDDAGNLVESGYQELQAYSDEVYYVIALPKDIDYNTMIAVQGYDTLNGAWESDNFEKFEMTSDLESVTALCDEAGIDISHIDRTKYTIWAAEVTPTGSFLRYVITSQEDVQ